MDSRLYEFKLANHKIFKDLKSGSSENPSGKLRNLLELKDDVLYVWSAVDTCLLGLNLKQFEEHGEETPYQKLHFLSPPSYSVERVMTSSCGSRICVWGSRGVTIAELPSRWGRGGLFDSGNPTVLCKSFSLDERFLYSQGEVRKVSWHPSSLSHVLVLVSDNTLRLYNIALKAGPKLVKIFPLGPKPSGQCLTGTTILDSLGDTAVDFTTTPDCEHLLILRGNGDVYMMACDLENSGCVRGKLSGPLAMYPPADDNYGTDSCSIIALGGDAPPLVVIATSSATLYHCLLLPNANEKEDGDSHALYVVEAVEINMVLNPDDDNMQYSYPVHLYPCTQNTYACMHAGGVHAVTLPLMGHLMDFALADEAEMETALSAMCTVPSSGRHLVCTSGGAATHPPAGLALAPPPLPALLVLCTDGTLLTRTLEPYGLEEQLYKELQLKNPALEQDDLNNILKERQKLSFTAIIQEILARDVSQPILNMNKKEEPTPKECLELLTQATLRLRGEYMSRQVRAADAIARKLAALTSLASHHDSWLADLQKEIDEVQLKSAVLREKCMLAEKVQDDIKYSSSAVIRALQGASAASAAERELLGELLRRQRAAEHMKDTVRRLKEQAHHKTEELRKSREDYNKKDIALGKSRSDTISSILQQQTSQISTLIEETKLLKDQLSIV